MDLLDIILKGNANNVSEILFSMEFLSVSHPMEVQ